MPGGDNRASALGNQSAALRVFAPADDELYEDKPSAAMLLGLVLAEARGEHGPWPALFAIEQLAAMVLIADGIHENGAPQVRVWREVELQPEASA